MNAEMLNNDDRKKLTFEQAEGVRPLPAQLKLKELSHGLRAALWHEVFQRLTASVRAGFENPYVVGHWATILRDMHALRNHQSADDFRNDLHRHQEQIKRTILGGNYVEAFGWLEWVIRHPQCPPALIKKLSETLERERASYRIIDGNTICPIGSEKVEAEREAAERAEREAAEQ